MPPVLGPPVAVVAGLVILGRRQGQGVRAVAETRERSLLADEQFLDDDFAARIAEALAGNHAPRRGHRFFDLPRHHHALAGGKAVRLDDDGCADGADVVFRRGRIRERLATRGRDAVASHEALGERLGPLPTGPRPWKGPKHRSPRASKASRMPATRSASGPTRVSATPSFAAKSASASTSAPSATLRTRPANSPSAAPSAAGAGIAGRHEDALHPRRTRRCPSESVFASAAAHHQDLHDAASAK